MKKKLVIFDFDGVIVSTLDFCYEIVKRANPDLTIEQYLTGFNGNINKQTVAKNPIPNFTEFYNPLLMQKDLVPGIKEVISALASKATLVIISATTSSVIKDFLKKHSIDTYFQEVLGNDVDYSKVVKIKMALKTHGLEPQDAVMITDTAGDIYEAHECGVQSIAVTWGYQTEELLKAARPEHLANSPSDITNYLIE